MAKLRHIALSVPDPEATAKFFMDTFDMEQVGTTESPLSTGIYLSDGTICMAVLNYKDDALAGTPGGKDDICVNHFGFWVDDLEGDMTAPLSGREIEWGRPPLFEPTLDAELEEWARREGAPSPTRDRRAKAAPTG